MPADSTLRNYASQLITYYVEQAATRKQPAEINRYTLKWGFMDLVQDVGGMAEARKIIDFYLDLPRPVHKPELLLSNYHRIKVMMEESVKNDADDAQVRRETEERANRWRTNVTNRTKGS